MHNIRIGIEQAKIALSDKDRLVAFCFALKIKFLFRASDLHYNSKNQAAKALGFNKPTFTQYLNLAIKFGYCRIDTNKFGVKKIIANKIHSSEYYSYKTRRGEIKHLSLPVLKNLVRKAVICNKINTIEEVINTRKVEYVGIEATVFLCRATVRQRKWLFELKYTIRTHTWSLQRKVC